MHVHRISSPVLLLGMFVMIVAIVGASAGPAAWRPDNVTDSPSGADFCSISWRRTLSVTLSAFPMFGTALPPKQDCR